MTSRKTGASSKKSDMAGGGKRAPQAEQQNSGTVTEDVKKRRSDPSDVPAGLRQEVESVYRLTMPDDFYRFWTFCAEINRDEPCDALKSSLGLQLVGPYDIISGKHKVTKKSSDINYNLHWRFFYDPPEFQTIIVGDSKTQYHIGYYRDSPEELPVFLGSNDAVKGYLITPAGDNVFSAVKQFAVKKLKDISDKKTVNVVKDLVEKLTAAADNLGYSLEQKTASMKRRYKKVVTRSFHGAGLVVPVDKKNNVGYRELPETDGNLKKICKAIVEASDDEKRMKAFAPIQEMITFVQFANDECDYGMGYELGIDLFCYGSHYFHKVTGQLLPLAYKLLKRDLFAEIIESHLANRSRENVSQLVT
ncbi:histone PARylation factor 1 isoform X1 [Bufo bufo]|uniref:histone PARylation factor 1 isoform X1 n=2 Tax=Bufo bufo TaxID=8384 RepID=UPI001ABE82F3|nr:histone PARylation factor 1 isoform X1 [Bufo bufo]